MSNKTVIDIFKDICHYPRGSGKEHKFVLYLKQVLTKLGCEVTIDKNNNIYAYRLNGKKPIVLLQAHTDMVWASDGEFDFENKPIPVYEEGGYLKAKGTTLGADNGIGVAYILYILGLKEFKDYPFEIFLSSQEEQGDGGAAFLLPNKFKSKYFINLDGVDETQLIVGSSGFREVVGSFPIKTKARPQNFINLCLSISGGLGGHSGLFIMRPRSNSLKSLVYMLKNLYKKYGLCIVESLPPFVANAIPSQYELVISLNKDKASAFTKDCKAEFDKIKKFWKTYEPNLKFSQTIYKNTPTIVDEASSAKIINACFAAKSSISHYLAEDDVPASSANFFKFMIAGSQCQFYWSLRGVSEEKINEVQNQCDSLIELLGGKLTILEESPTWSKTEASHLCDVVLAEGKKLKLHLKRVFVGGATECGCLKNKYPNADILSFGPTIDDFHTYHEKVSIASINRIQKLLINSIKTLYADKTK